MPGVFGFEGLPVPEAATAAQIMRAYVQGIMQLHSRSVSPGQTPTYTFDTLHLIDRENTYHYVYKAINRHSQATQRGIYIARPLIGNLYNGRSTSRAHSRHYTNLQPKSLVRVDDVPVIGPQRYEFVEPQEPHFSDEDTDARRQLVQDLGQLGVYKAIQPLTNRMDQVVPLDF